MSTAHTETNRTYPQQDQQPDWSVLYLLGGSTALVALALAVLWYVDAHTGLLQIVQWVNQQGAWSALLFVLIMALVVILLLPGVFFTTAAGFFFGLFMGTVYVVVGTTLGAAIAFLAARFLLGKRAQRALLSNLKLRSITHEEVKNEFRVILLTRLVPFFPFKLSNYVFGATGFTFTRFVSASFIGCIPFSLHNVYLGSMAADLASVAAGEFHRSPVQWGVYGAGFVTTVILVVYIARLARRTLAAEQQGYISGRGQ